MTLHRIEHTVVMDTDDIPGRGGYAVVGISPGVTPAERSFIAGNFGISDYLHDPKTDDRVFYSYFRVPGGRRAFVRRFARGKELRRNNTQRRLVVHTLFLDDAVHRDLYGLPWLLLNARDVLRRDIAVDHAAGVLAPLVWNTDDGAATGIAARLSKRLENLGGRAPLVARTISALAQSQRTRVVLPQDSAHEWITVLAWSMLPWRDREELSWTQHDTMNVAGVTFHLANARAEPATNLPDAARFATEIVEMNVASDDSWRDFQERTARHPLTVRQPRELEAWLDWRAALIRLRRHDLRSPEHEVVDDMRKLAATTQESASAVWIDAEEVLQLIWPNVPAAVAQGQPREVAVRQWGGRLQQSGLGAVIFRAAPKVRWLDRAAKDVGADALVWFFLLGSGDDAASATTRNAIAEWILASNVRDVHEARLARLAFRLATDDSPAMPQLLERLLEADEGLTALHKLLAERNDGHDLVDAAVPIALKRAHPGTPAFLRDVFLPRLDRARLTPALARDVAEVLRDDPPTFIRFASQVSPDLRRELMQLVTQWVFRETERSVPLARELLRLVQRQEGTIATAGPLAIALAAAGEPAQVWFETILRIARSTDARHEAAATRDFLQMLDSLRERSLDLTGAIHSLVALLETEGLRPGDSIRAVILLLRPSWASGESRFARALAEQIERSARATAWESIVIAYAADHARTRRDDVSQLVAAFWMKVDPASVSQIGSQTIGLLQHVTGNARRRLTAHWSKKIRSLPDSPASDRLLEFVLGERAAVSHEQQAELALRDIEQGVADARTLNRLDTCLYKLHDRKYADLMASALETYVGKGDAVARVVRVVELIESNEVMPTVRLVLERRVLPRAVKALRRGEWKDVQRAVRGREIHGVAGIALARGPESPLRAIARAVRGT